MQTRFIENIAALDLKNLCSLKADLEGVFWDSQLRDLLVALGVIPEFGAVLVQESDLRQQLGVISDLLSHITRVEAERCWVKLGRQDSQSLIFDTTIPLENSVFQCFLFPERQASALRAAEQGAQWYQEQLSSGEISDDSFELDAPADRPLLRRTPSSPNVMTTIRNFVQRTPRDYSNALGEVQAIETQQRFLDSLAVGKLDRLRTVLENLELRYPGEGRAQSPVKSLVSFAQFVVVLMADALVQLNGLLNQAQHNAIKNNSDYSKLISNITALTARLASTNPLVPHVEQIQDLQSQQSIEQFLGHLGSTSGQVIPKGMMPRTPNDTRQRANSAEPQTYADIAQPSAPINNSRPNNASLYPMPAYLAKSFQACLAEAIEDDVSRVNRASWRPSTNSKAIKMSEVAEALKTQVPKTTFWDIYNDTVFAGSSLLAILREQRNPGPGNEATSFGKTLFSAGIEFLAKNSASLMRRYVYLTQLSAFVTFRDSRQEDFHKAHLKKTIKQMSTLRKAMRVLYWNTFSFTDVQKHMTQLISLARQDSSIEKLVRLFCVACLDKMNEQEFGRLALDTKNWLLERTSLNKEDFIKAVAQGIRDVRGVEKALLEIASFQQARYNKPIFGGSAYTISDHQTKIETVAIHLGACLDNYFVKPYFGEDASVIDLQLLEPEIRAHASGAVEEYKAGDEPPPSSQVQNTPGANPGIHETRLRLITNLELHWQAVLASNVGSITATTLALVNSGDTQALEQWIATLAASRIESPELRANLLILRDLFDGAGQKKIFFSPPEFMEQGTINIKEVQGYNQKFDERVLDYKARMAFVDVLLNHLQYDLNSSERRNEELTTLFKLAFAVLDDLADEEGSLYLYENAPLCMELSHILEPLTKTGEDQIYTAHYLDRLLEAMEGGFYGVKAQAKLTELFPDNSEAISRINLIKTKTEEIQELNKSIQSRRERLLRICYPVQTNSMDDATPNGGVAEVSARIKAISEAVYGKPENIFNPNVGVPFKHGFTTAIQSGNHDFFIKALFTRSHHPIKPAGYEKTMCLEIATSLEGSPSAPFWQALGKDFYGNGDALQGLFADYYRSLGLLEGGEEVLPARAEMAASALRIAIFGFSHPLFKDFKTTFARDIVLTLAKISADIALGLVRLLDIHLVDVLATLVNASEIISAEEKTAIDVLKEVVERLGSKSLINHHHVLSVRAEKQQLAREYLNGLLSAPSNSEAGLATEVIPSAPPIPLDHVFDIVAGINNRREAHTDHSYTTDYNEFEFFIKRVTDVCFPVGYRYYPLTYTNGAGTQFDCAETVESRLTSDAAKLTRNGNRDQLTAQCRNAIADMLKAKTLKVPEKDDPLSRENVQVLVSKMNELRGTVLQGSLETTIQTLNFVAPHALDDLTERELGGAFTDSQVVNAFVIRVEKFAAKFGHSSLTLPQNQPAPAIDSSSSAAVAVLSSEAPAPVSVHLPAPQVNAPQTVTDAIVLAATQWFDASEEPTADHNGEEGNAPKALRNGFNVGLCTRENLNAFMRGYRKIGYKDLFERRVQWIREGRSEYCWKEILETNINQNDANAEQYGELGLSGFIRKLKEKADSDLAQYQSCLDAFIWSLAQAGANEQVAAEAEAEAEAVAEAAEAAEAAEEAAEAVGAPSPLNSKLQILEGHDFYWNDLIFLGCKHYAGMKPAERSQTGAPLLKALVHFAKNLANLVEDEEMRRIDAFINEVSENVRAKHPSLSDIERDKKVKHYIRNALLGVQGEIENFITTDSEDFKISSVGDRQTYAAYLLIKMLFDEQITQNDADVYYAIYTLTQAHALSASSEEAEGAHVDDDDFVVSQEKNNISLKSTDLLNRFNAQLADKGYAQWHREILVVGAHLHSSIDSLIRHKPLLDADWQKKIDDSHCPNSLLDLNEIESRPYYWEDFDKIYHERFAYEAHAVYELQKLLDMKEFHDESLDTQYLDEYRNLQYQHNHEIEQQALAFMAAKYFLDDEYTKDTTAPFTEAIRLIAKARQKSELEILEDILRKACKSLNDMLSTEDRKVYALNRTKNVSLKREIMGWNNLGGRRVQGWIESNDFIKQVYIQTTLEPGVSSEEQADFVLQLLSGEVSQASVTNRPGSVRSETAFSLSSTPVENGVSTPPKETAVSSEGEDNPLLDRVQLLFKAFDFKYAQINRAVQAKSLFSRDLLSEPLKIFMQQIGKYNLWQEYYAYIAYNAANNCDDFAEFAQYTTVQNPRHLIVHANEIFDALTSEATSCENPDNRPSVMCYILKSWCVALSNEQFKNQYLKEIKQNPQSLYNNNVLDKCFMQFKSGQIEGGETTEAKLAKYWEQFHNDVPQEIQQLLIKLATHLGVHAKPGYKAPGNDQENGRGSLRTEERNPMHLLPNQQRNLPSLSNNGDEELNDTEEGRVLVVNPILSSNPAALHGGSGSRRSGGGNEAVVEVQPTEFSL